MEDKALDWTASPKALEAAVHQITWIADLSLKKLSSDDAETMRRHREDIQASLNQLLETLSRVAPHEAAEIERCTARLLHVAGWIWHLSPLPSPNVRKKVRGEARAIGRHAKAVKHSEDAVTRACKAEFETRRSKWEAHPYTETRHAADAINKALEKQGIDKRMTEKAVYKRFRALAQAPN